MISDVRKIAFYLPTLNGGGAERAMLILAHGLADTGFSVDLVLAQAKGPYLEDVKESIRLVNLKASRALTSLPSLVRYLKREKPDVMVSALDYANVIALLARRLAGYPQKVLVNEQNTISRSARNSTRRRQRMVPHLVRRFYPWADFIVGNSRGVADDLCQVTKLSSERIKILYNPIVRPELKDKTRAPLNHPWFEENQPPVLLSVGRLTQQKDFPTLIRSFAEVRKTQMARLLILGEGPDRPELEQLIKSLGIEKDVSLPGFVDNPYAYMSRASIYVLSSRWEGLPTGPLEALFCGLPIISTDCPSGPREILAGGLHGILVPVGDIAALSRSITSALAGNIPKPTPESWRPYTLETVVGEYAELLSNNHS